MRPDFLFKSAEYDVKVLRKYFRRYPPHLNQILYLNRFLIPFSCSRSSSYHTLSFSTHPSLSTPPLSVSLPPVVNTGNISFSHYVPRIFLPSRYKFSSLFSPGVYNHLPRDVQINLMKLFSGEDGSGWMFIEEHIILSHNRQTHIYIYIYFFLEKKVYLAHC